MDNNESTKLYLNDKMQGSCDIHVRSLQIWSSSFEEHCFLVTGTMHQEFKKINVKIILLCREMAQALVLLDTPYLFLGHQPKCFHENQDTEQYSSYFGKLYMLTEIRADNSYRMNSLADVKGIVLSSHQQ